MTDESSDKKDIQEGMQPKEWDGKAGVQPTDDGQPLPDKPVRPIDDSTPDGGNGDSNGE